MVTAHTVTRDLLGPARGPFHAAAACCSAARHPRRAALAALERNHQTARRNALVANTKLLALRGERNDVEAYFRNVPAAVRPGQAGPGESHPDFAETHELRAAL